MSTLGQTTHSCDPVLAADSVGRPTSGPYGLEQRGQVSDGEQRVTLGEKTESVENVSPVGRIFGQSFCTRLGRVVKLT